MKKPVSTQGKKIITFPYEVSFPICVLVADCELRLPSREQEYLLKGHNTIVLTHTTFLIHTSDVHRRVGSVVRNTYTLLMRTTSNRAVFNPFYEKVSSLTRIYYSCELFHGGVVFIWGLIDAREEGGFIRFSLFYMMKSFLTIMSSKLLYTFACLDKANMKIGRAHV